MKILFIGNSHTFVHYVPLRVKHYLEKQLENEVDVTMLAIPAIGLDSHLEYSQTYFNLMYGNYDLVILQHNAHPFPGKQSLLQSGKRIKELTPDKTEIYLYMTWSEKNNPEGQKVMSEAYEELSELIGATLCPVGDWFKIFRETYPDELYFSDGEHSSVFGASLAAVIIARTILKLPLIKESIYEEVKELERYEYDQRMIDLYSGDGILKMK